MKQYRTWLKINTLAKRGECGGGGTCQSKCTVWISTERTTIDLNGDLEGWINCYSGLVTPQVGTIPPPLNKQRHADMAAYTVNGTLHTSPPYPIERG